MRKHTLTLLRHFSSTTSPTPNLPPTTKSLLPTLLPQIPYKHRPLAITSAQQILTDYLHTTRSLPFTYADLISKHSLHSLSSLISKVPFSPGTFPKSLLKFLRYNPINEFRFFYESIGIEHDLVGLFLKPDVHFFSDDGNAVLDAACVLAGFGFPWNKLGLLYVERKDLFERRKDGGVLSTRLNELQGVGFSNQQVVGICLAFPSVLSVCGDGECGEVDGLVDVLRRVFVGFDVGEGSLDDWYQACRKVRFLYELGVEIEKVGEIGNESKRVVFDCPEKEFVEKIEFFCRFGVSKAEVGLLLLENPELLRLEIGDRVISVKGLLEDFGVEDDKLESIMEEYSYVLGRNKMANLPHILRALDLHEWFFNKIKCGNSQLLASYELSSPDEGEDEEYLQNLEKIKSSRMIIYGTSKLEFLHGIGFGENSFAAKLVWEVHGSASDLQERFEFLLSQGYAFSKLCKMIKHCPRIMNQEMQSLKEKLNFLREEIDFPMDYLERFPAYLLYNLEKRIKPRYRLHHWLMKQGLCKKKYTLASIIAISEKGFLLQLSKIHPSAPQLWLERSAKIKQGL